MRMAAGKARLQKIVAYSEKKKALVLLENLNKEPDNAEVHYLAHTVEEWQYYWDIKSPSFKLSFTVNHAHLVPEGIKGFVKALDFNRVHEVRLADCWRNGFEEHLVPGKGNLNFGKMFKNEPLPERGYIELPTTPGFGLELNRNELNLIRRYDRSQS